MGIPEREVLIGNTIGYKGCLKSWNITIFFFVKLCAFFAKLCATVFYIYTKGTKETQNTQRTTFETFFVNIPTEKCLVMILGMGRCVVNSGGYYRVLVVWDSVHGS